MNVFAVEHDRAFDTGRGDRVVHAVERPQKGRLAAARGADERSDVFGRDIDRHIVDRLLVPVEYGDVPRAHLGVGVL